MPLRKLLAVLFLFAIQPFAVLAEDQTNYDESGLNPARQYVDQGAGERIDPFSGNLSLQYVDLAIPGNGGFDLAVHRSYNSNAIGDTLSPFGRGWQIHFGKVEHGSAQLCAAAIPQSMKLDLPDGSRATLHKSNGVAGTATSDYITTSFWKAQCLSGGGIAVFSPDGLRYDMTADDGRAWSTTRITDKWGNFATISYVLNSATGMNVVSKVSGNDGRTITFTYSGGKLTSISGGGVTWGYTVSTASDGSYQLTGVNRPVAGDWSFVYNGNLGTSAGSFAMKQVTNPFGGVTTYSYAFESRSGPTNSDSPISVISARRGGGIARLPGDENGKAVEKESRGGVQGQGGLGSASRRQDDGGARGAVRRARSSDHRVEEAAA